MRDMTAKSLQKSFCTSRQQLANVHSHKSSLFPLFLCHAYGDTGGILYFPVYRGGIHFLTSQ